MRETFQGIQPPVEEMYPRVGDGETSLAGHLMAIQKQKIT